MKKVAIFIYSLGGGGAERVALELALGLRDVYEVELVTVSPTQNYDSHGIKTTTLYKHDFESSSLAKLFSIFKIAALFAKYCRQNKIEVVISFLSRPNIIAALSKLLCPKIKVLATEHTTLSSYYGAGLAQRILKKLLILSYKLSSRVIAVSYGIRDDLVKNFALKKEKVDVIYNPIDISRIKTLALQKAQRQGNEGFVFVSAGRLIESKNYPFLFEAFAALPSFCKLWILGSGELERELKFLAVEMGLHERITFFGFCENPYSYFASADCFVMSSRLEGLPTVLIEALACGIPVISTDCKSGPREILMGGDDTPTSGIERGEFGLLTSLDNPRFLSLAMSKMIEDDDMRTQYISRAKGRAEFFSKEKSIEEYNNLIESLEDSE